MYALSLVVLLPERFRMQLMTKSRQLEAQRSLRSQGNTLGTLVLYTNVAWTSPKKQCFSLSYLENQDGS